MAATAAAGWFGHARLARSASRPAPGAGEPAGQFGLAAGMPERELAAIVGYLPDIISRFDLQKRHLFRPIACRPVLPVSTLFCVAA